VTAANIRRHQHALPDFEVSNLIAYLHDITNNLMTWYPAYPLFVFSVLPVKDAQVRTANASTDDF
jgi:hypothetical protein